MKDQRKTSQKSKTQNRALSLSHIRCHLELRGPHFSLGYWGHNFNSIPLASRVNSETWCLDVELKSLIGTRYSSTSLTMSCHVCYLRQSKSSKGCLTEPLLQLFYSLNGPHDDCLNSLLIRVWILNVYHWLCFKCLLLWSL